MVTSRKKNSIQFTQTEKEREKSMQTTPKTMRPAQTEVHRTAHDQDLIEVPKRAKLDREAEVKEIPQILPVSDNQSMQ